MENYTVFISHAGEDKATIAIPLRERLREEGISAFVDDIDMSPGTEAISAMMNAIERASVAVIVLSPEFVARKWTMLELMHFLKRQKEFKKDALEPPTVIPCFYRLRIDELYDEPRLDRVDEDGNSLYEKSRFYERQQDGDPEANTEAIKHAMQTVHGIMGVRNDVDATNRSSYLMSTRREIILNRLCCAVCKAIRGRSKSTSLQDPTNVGSHESFRAFFDAPFDISNLVFDFSRDEENVKRCAQEREILEMLLDKSREKDQAIAVWGRTGIGKTSLLEGIRTLENVKRRFRDGIYHVTMGKYVTCVELIEMLSRAVEKSGGEEVAKRMRVEINVEKVRKEFEEWFRGKECLFAVDDILETEQISGGVIRRLLTLHKLGKDSKVLVTTRSMEIAAGTTSQYRLRARAALADESRNILYGYSGLKPGVPREEYKEENDAVDAILRHCAGLPVFLAVAGRAVKILRLRPRHSGCDAYHIYAEKLNRSLLNMVTAGIDKYEGLHAGLMIAIELVEERSTKLGFHIKLCVAEMHRRLSVLRKGARVPMRLLMYLWEVEDEYQAEVIAKELEHIGLADMECERREGGVVELLRLHDSVYEFTVHESRKRGEERAAHQAIIRGYGSCVKRTTKGHREWWTRGIEVDGYIHRSICRHLIECGYVREVGSMLLTPQWTERQLVASGILCLESDFARGINGIRAETREDGNREAEELKEALELMKEGLRLSSGYIGRNVRELWFQMHGRLHGYREHNRLIQEYVKWIETETTRPQLLSSNRVLAEPGGPNTRIICVGTKINCMVSIQGGYRVVCAMVGGWIAVVNVHQSEVEREWKAHEQQIASIAAVRDGTRVITRSHDKSIRLWEVQSGRCVAKFTGHCNKVTCVAIMHNGKLAAFGHYDGTFQVWEVDTVRPVTGQIESFHGVVHCIVFFGDEGQLVTGGLDGQLRFWNIATSAQAGAPFQAHSSPVRWVAITRDEQRVASGSEDGAVKLWDIKSHRQIGRSLHGVLDSFRQLPAAVNADGTRVIFQSENYTIAVWDLISGKQVCQLLKGHSHMVTGVSFLGYEDSLISCSWDESLRVWDVNRSKTERASAHHEKCVRGVSFSLDGKLVASASLDKTVRIWDVGTGEPIADPLEGHADYVYDVAVTPDGRYIVSVSSDKTVRVWDLRRRSLLYTFTGHTETINCVAIMPKGDLAVTGADDKTVRVWNIGSTEGSHFVLEGHPGDVERVFLSEDELRIISVDWNRNIFVWDIERKNMIRKVKTELAWPCLRLATRAQMLRIAREPSGSDYSGESIQVVDRRSILCQGSGAGVLGTLDDEIYSWEMSSDKKTICAGLGNGKVAFLKLQMPANNDCVDT